MNIKIIYSAGSTLDCYILSPEGDAIWNTVHSRWDDVDSLTTWTDYTIDAIDSGNVSVYLCEIPATLPANIAGEKYTLIVSKRQGADPVKSDPEIGGSDFYWSTSTALDITITISSFSTAQNADDFFAQLLYKDAWTSADSNDKQKALNQATQAINRLPYKGVKTDGDQDNEFPRTGIFRKGIEITGIPNEIILAQYFEAFELLSGADLNRERKGTNVTSRGLSSVRTTYDSTQVQEWLLAGLTSPIAWDYLSPFIDRNNSSALFLRRVS